MSSTEDKLNKIREIQKVTGPNFCVASSKFFCGKLIGLYRGESKLNDHLHSIWGRKMNHDALCSAWGHIRVKSMEDFNNRVLPASLKPEAGVKAPVLPTEKPIEFVQFTNGALAANSLLKSGAPIVAGVDFPGGEWERDHFITLVMDSNHELWAVDSWDKSTAYSAVKLPADTDLTKPILVDMNAGPTLIPCPKPWFGYFRERLSKRALQVTYAI